MGRHTMRLFGRIVGAVVLAAVPSPAFAEVSDKVSSIPEHWILALPVAAIMLVASRWRWWLALPLALPLVVLIWAGLELPSEPYIGPALLQEQGWLYFASLWGSDLVMAAGFGVGAWLGWRRRLRAGTPLSNPPLQDMTVAYARSCRRTAGRWTDMKRLWQVIAIGVLGVAACQWITLSDQIVHGVVGTFKTGWNTPILTAGTGMLRLFLLLSAVAAAAGALVARRLRESSPGLERCARLGAYSLVGGAALWLGLIASPIVDLVQR